MRQADIPGAKCPHCNGDADVATTIEDALQPQDGSVAVCFHCGGICIYVDNATRLRAASPFEAMAIECDPRLAIYRAILERVKKPR